MPKQVERPAHNTKVLYSPLSPALSSWSAMAAPGNRRMAGPADRLAVVAVPVDQAIAREERAAERASPVGRPGAVDVEAKAELPRRAVAVDCPAAREGFLPEAVVGWRAVGVLEAPRVKVALAGRRAAPKPGAADNRLAAAQRVLVAAPLDRV